MILFQIQLCMYLNRAKALLVAVMRSWFAVGLIFSLHCSGCSDRPRLNPLDPQNPDTLGRPTGLDVVSVRDTVRLQWDQLEVRDLTGFRIYRQLEGEAGFFPIALTLPGAFTFQELGTTYGVQHTYRISAVAADFESPPSADVTITPGPAFSWVADAGTGDLVKLSHDGMHTILRSSELVRPHRLRIDARRRTVWVLDRFGGEIVRINSRGERVASNRRSLGAADLSIDDVDGSVWVADSLDNGLTKFDSTGTLIKGLKNYKGIVALAMHPATGELWALDRATRRVLIFSRNGDLRRTLPIVLQRPYDLDIDSRTGKVWIADANRVLRLDAQGESEALALPPLRLVFAVVADEATGGCWLIDYSSAIRDSNILKLRPSGEMLFVGKGFDIPERLAVNPFDGSCLVADYGNGRVVRISADGSRISSYERVFAPIDVDTAQ